ncbi:MAG: hypothetical protein QM539_07765 [Alphaproteobacteria bacterium]|nr:hypothetical protein [Alphaproteobacteria bacterium]
MTSLKNLYLQIAKNVCTEVLENTDNIAFVFYDNPKRVLITPARNTIFTQLHKCQYGFLKLKNNLGTKCFQLNGIILDNNILETDRDLQCLCDSKANILTVFLE